MLTQKNQPNKFTDNTKWGRVTYAGNGYSSVQKHPELQAADDVNPKDTRDSSQQQPYEIQPGQVQCLAPRQDDPKHGTARGWQAGLPPCWRGAGAGFELLTEPAAMSAWIRPSACRVVRPFIKGHSFSFYSILMWSHLGQSLANRGISDYVPRVLCMIKKSLEDLGFSYVKSRQWGDLISAQVPKGDFQSWQAKFFSEVTGGTERDSGCGLQLGRVKLDIRKCLH